MKSTHKWHLPHIYIILLFMMVLFAILSYIVPAGQFERVVGPTGAQIIKPGSFSFIEQSPVTFMKLMLAIPNGLVQSGVIIFAGLMLGGMFSVFTRAGIIDLGLHKLSQTFANKGILIIPVLMIVFGVFTSFSGALELCLIYLPIIVPLVLKLGFDRITAAAIVLCSTIAGFAVAMTAPATTVLAQQLAELPLYSGMGYRAVMFFCFLTVGIWFVMRYAKKIKKNPETGILYEEKEKDAGFLKTDEVVPKATQRQVVATIAMIVGFGMMFYLSYKYEWYFLELAGFTIIMGAIVGLIAGLKPREVCESFTKGFHNILNGVMIIGIARGVTVILSEGNILDTIVYGISELITGLPSSITAVAMLIVQTFFNFLVPSGSGQAVITMPVMTGISDLAGVTRQTAVLAFQMGDGISNIVFPTSGYFMATLATAKIAWGKWIRFLFPLLLIWYVMAAIFLIIAQLMLWGPF